MGATVVPVQLGAASYDVLIGEGILNDFPALLTRHCHAARYALISDTTVSGLYGERLLAQLSAVAPCTLVTFPAGEWNKTRETWADLTDKLLAAGLGRDAAVIALGGGVVGDVGGFVAATYMRGIPYVQVPTTLLGMLDSSVGGKTGIDTPFGKNLVGAFHQPRAVFADVATLRTLPRQHMAGGIAEALKHGAIADAGYFHGVVAARDRILARDPAVLLDVISRGVAIKADVVGRDERESGPRAVLNFGHTIGHAIEVTSGYEVLHGEAVALGMILEATLGVALGVTRPEAAAALRNAVATFGLPLDRPTEATGPKLLEAMTRDKKVRAGSVRFALIEEIGSVARGPGDSWTISASEDAILDVLGT